MPVISGSAVTLTSGSPATPWLQATSTQMAVDVRSAGAVRVEAALTATPAASDIVPLSGGVTGATGPSTITGPTRMTISTIAGDYYRVVLVEGASVGVAVSQ